MSTLLQNKQEHPGVTVYDNISLKYIVHWSFLRQEKLNHL